MITRIYLVLLIIVPFIIAPLDGFFFHKKAKSAATTETYTVMGDNGKPLSPVIFVPGDGGSQMDATIDKNTSVHYICGKKTTDYFNIWLNLELLVPLVIDCWIDNVKLIYNNETRKTTNTPGVQTRIPGWGTSEVVEWIDPTHASAGAYFKDIGNALVSIGYERNKSLRGAPFDFRKAPNENKQWFLDFKDLIEETYEANGKIPVTLIVHSMGAPMTLVFLQNLPASWKDQYIARVISLAGAWAGSVKAIKVYAVGDSLGSYALNGKVLRAEQITSPSLAWLLPSKYFWKENEILVQTTSRAYTITQLEDFFNDLHYPNGWEMKKDVEPYTDFTAPGVELHCLYGTGMATVEKLDYKKSGTLDGGSPTLINGDGDGTVNLRSLAACERWLGTREQRNKNITTMGFPGIDHMTVLSNSQVVKYILDVLSPADD